MKEKISRKAIIHAGFKSIAGPTKYGKYTMTPRKTSQSYQAGHLELPKRLPQPMKEDDLLARLLEQTNERYAVAGIAGIELCNTYNQTSLRMTYYIYHCILV